MTEQPQPKSSVAAAETSARRGPRRLLGLLPPRRATAPVNKEDKPGNGTAESPAAKIGRSEQTAPAAKAGTLEKKASAPATAKDARPPGAPPDPWSVFAAIPEQPPGLLRRTLRALSRSVVHEYALVVYAGCLLAVMMTWPTLRYPMHTLPQDLGDPTRQAWRVAWAGHAVIDDPARLWQSNAYYPQKDSFAFGDSLFGYAFAGMLGDGPSAAILRYNILFVLAHALLLIGAYALVRQLGARPTGAAVAAVAFAYAPWRLAQEGHLNIISAGAIPLALAMLARGHGYSLRYGFRPKRRRAAWAVAGWLTAIWQLTLGFSLGIPFAYALGLILITLVAAGLIRNFRQSRREKRAAAVPGRRWSLRRGRRAALAGPAEAAKSAVPAPAGASVKAASKADGPEPEVQPVAAPLKPGVTGPETPPVTDPPKPGRPRSEVQVAASMEVGKATPAGPRTDVLESPPRRRWISLGRYLAGPPRPERKPVIGWLLTNINILGATIFLSVGILMAVPYIRLKDTGSRIEEITFFSPPLRSLLIGPAESRIWGAAHATPRASLGWAAEMSLLPGFALYALALAGLFLSVWRLRHRAMLVIGLVVTVILTLGTNFFGGHWTYLPVFGHFPAAFDLRIPGRLMLWVTLLLAILAAGAVDDFVRRIEHWAAQRIPPWPGPWLRLATLIPLILVALEGWNTTAHPQVAAQPPALRTVPGPMLVLPTADLTDQTVQLWTTSRFQQIANGGGGFNATQQNELRAKAAGFPDATSIEYLESIGVRKVLLLRDQVAGTSWEDAVDLPVDALQIRREDLPDAVVFYLN
ncbi:hypothetical protein FHR83_008207 [Actinoplanes campanulatus]|uniref:Uncharacterized protein n=1 Tax=Actinoplanes campanulatus TaxID=113559 RepID=A0A7W5AQJ9_9ACTN|nr:hypothetical protein [Actinoplanes campanulatus]MBB3100485.1 hypothetical protein [Actinoplanes campanulatus]GGN25120.1 hypothetical protein GCM10010109_41120 [Actinoplanes campanulatus]GID39477.1 hypothetical protein Aca09nite_59830 [Actinoplanes campanulatus]